MTKHHYQETAAGSPDCKASDGLSGLKSRRIVFESDSMCKTSSSSSWYLTTRCFSRRPVARSCCSVFVVVQAPARVGRRLLTRSKSSSSATNCCCCSRTKMMITNLLDLLPPRLEPCSVLGWSLLRSSLQLEDPAVVHLYLVHPRGTRGRQRD